jgi:hypothetical protein
MVDPKGTNGSPLTSTGANSVDALIAALSPSQLEALRETQKCLREAMAADPEFAKRMLAPIPDEEPQHEILDRFRAGEFRR